MEDEELIPYSLKSAIYRITCEACGNAIRHGKCKNIQVNIHIHPKDLVISIVDDGSRL